MYVSVKNITPKNHLVKLADLPTGTAFRVKDNLYVKPEVVIDLSFIPPKHLIQVINIQNMSIEYWHKCTCVQPVRIREAEIKYDDLYGEDA